MSTWISPRVTDTDPNSRWRNLSGTRRSADSSPMSSVILRYSSSNRSPARPPARSPASAPAPPPGQGNPPAVEGRVEEHRRQRDGVQDGGVQPEQPVAVAVVAQ